ncbi:flavodoxin family protein [Oceanispirochaeta sp.]|jgi:multimeric flavodoxin WrbA|uniref:flavodoxin family protein n=1 Tax=Oceanispirochaeta sp. TaxID=2035350 RepID=UPI00261D2FBA|nr:flavodoxin family protein [Oceanispirochaeta sp.]MDA3958622.1 flavodoxin family protein [Oceanispirochaeta sp.]
MNILGISGSPHINGNTAYSVQYALDQLTDSKIVTKYISLANKTINPCQGCFSCAKNSRCELSDDMDEIYEIIRWCDAIVIGSPVYMGMVSGHVKVFMDRCVAFRSNRDKSYELSGKMGCGIACGGFRNGGQETTLQNIHTFLLQQNIKVISDGFPYCHAGGTIVGNAETDDIGLQTIKNLMTNLIRMNPV